MRNSRFEEEEAAGPGCAALHVAALRSAPLRQAPPLRREPASPTWLSDCLGLGKLRRDF
jgi:hypothetical protein